MGHVRDIADSLWYGTASTLELSPMGLFLGLEDYAMGLAFVGSFANVVGVETREGLLLVDAGSELAAPGIQAALRGWSHAPVHTLVYTHGHVDHVMGAALFEAEPRPTALPPMRVVAHHGVAKRFARYRLTAEYSGRINARQFRVPNLVWPTAYREPDISYHGALVLSVGGVDVELYHDRGETDDHTWLWLPAYRAICAGDLFIWASPNCGNPQKVQRYPREWAAALRRMMALEPELLFPGHGPPIEGPSRVREALSDTATFLESLVEQTLALMNQGAPLDVILAEVRAPQALLERPYLRPVYDDPEFVVRNIVRQYGGWWDGDPSHLKPAREGDVAREVAELAGGAQKLADRARERCEAGELRLACQLIEWAARAAPSDPGIGTLRGVIYRKRAESESSLMARSIYEAAAEGEVGPGGADGAGGSGGTNG
jgi:alkyl sulfatase BDS1-like metallo-beta-lactamase superfamily hydrolase